MTTLTLTDDELFELKMCLSDSTFKWMELWFQASDKEIDYLSPEGAHRVYQKKRELLDKVEDLIK